MSQVFGIFMFVSDVLSTIAIRLNGSVALASSQGRATL